MKDNDLNDRLVDADTGAAVIGIKGDTLRRWARKGYIPSYKVRGARRFSLAELKKLVVRRPAGQKINSADPGSSPCQLTLKFETIDNPELEPKEGGNHV
jgi:excisionase family DNA binding protein